MTPTVKKHGSSLEKYCGLWRSFLLCAIEKVGKLGTVQKLLVTSTPYKCSAAKNKIAGIEVKGIKSNALCQDFLMPQMDI